MRLDGRTIRKSSQNIAKSALTPREPDLATPRGYAARITKIGYGKSRVRSKDAKPVTPPLQSRSIQIYKIIIVFIMWRNGSEERGDRMGRGSLRVSEIKLALGFCAIGVWQC